MTAKVIDGKAFAAGLRAKVEAETARLKREHGIVPGLATVLVGTDPASEVYVRNKNKTAKDIGFHSVSHSPPCHRQRGRGAGPGQGAQRR